MTFATIRRLEWDIMAVKPANHLYKKQHKWHAWKTKWECEAPLPLTLSYFEQMRPFKNKYISEKVDYWETPNETVYRGADCDGQALCDYARAKHRGAEEENVRLAMVRDHHYKQYHMIFLQRLTKDTPWVVWDCQGDREKLAEDIKYYEPVYHINDGGFWMSKHGHVVAK